MVFIAPVATQAAQEPETPEATYLEPVAFDTSAPLRTMVATAAPESAIPRQHPRGDAVDGNLEIEVAPRGFGRPVGGRARSDDGGDLGDRSDDRQL